MDEKTMSEALDAVHDVAVGLLKHDTPEEVREGLQLIISIARYKFDVRTKDEVARSDGSNWPIV